jgi:hypothetical protein
MKVYSGDEVTVQFGSINIESGRGEDDFVRIERVNGPSFGVKSGLDGEQTRWQNKDRATRVVVVLMQSSKFNDLLSAVHNADLKANGSGIFPLMVRDRNGTSLLTGAEAYIEDFPDETFSKEPGTLEWPIMVPNPERFVGGN